MPNAPVKRTFFVAATTIILVLSGVCSTSAGEPRLEVRQATQRFYRALNTMFTGDVAPMLDLWSHADDVTYMGPFGKILVGWEKISAAWKQQARLKLGGRVEPSDLHIVANDSLGVTVGYERGTNYQDGKPLSVAIRATNVFRRESGEWKMIGHHTDLFHGPAGKPRTP